MEFCNLDMITRRTLLELGLPIHYYIEYLTHNASALRELNKDTLRIINSANLPVNDYKAVDLPADFVDDLAVCVPAGEFLQQVSKRSSINPLRLHSATTGEFVPYTDINTSENSLFLGFPMVWSWYWNFTDYGEPTGRLFGSPGGARANGYEVFKERRQIQLTQSFTSSNVILLYIGNGQSITNATQIDWAAFMAIQKFAEWQSSENRNNINSPEGRMFFNERRRLRSALNPLTKTDIVNIYRESYRASMKS